MYNLQGDKIDRRVCIACLSLGISLLQQGFSLSWVLLMVFLTACLKLYSTHTFMCQQVSLCHKWLSGFSPGVFSPCSGVTKNCGKDAEALLVLPLGMLALSGIPGFGFFWCFFVCVFLHPSLFVYFPLKPFRS